MVHELDALIVGEALACRLEHELGEVKTHTKHLGAIDPKKGEQATVPRPEVEDATRVVRHMLDQDPLSLCAARIPIRPAEIAMDMVGGRPLLGGHAFIIGLAHRAGSAPDPNLSVRSQ